MCYITQNLIRSLCTYISQTLSLVLLPELDMRVKCKQFGQIASTNSFSFLIAHFLPFRDLI